MNKPKFFSLAEMRQPVNQWLCIAFLGVFCFWTLLYYFTQKTQLIGESYASDTNYFIQNSEIRSQPARKVPITTKDSRVRELQ